MSATCCKVETKFTKGLFTGVGRKVPDTIWLVAPSQFVSGIRDKLGGMQLKVWSRLSQHVMAEGEIRSTKVTPSAGSGSTGSRLASGCLPLYCKFKTVPKGFRNIEQLFALTKAEIAERDSQHSKLKMKFSGGSAFPPTPSPCSRPNLFHSCFHVNRSNCHCVGILHSINKAHRPSFKRSVSQRSPSAQITQRLWPSNWYFHPLSCPSRTKTVESVQRGPANVC